MRKKITEAFVIDLINSLKDVFPSASFALGGSWARKQIVSPEIQELLPSPSDVDIYIENADMTRGMFRSIVEEIIFKGGEVLWESREPVGDNSYYKMPGVKRRVACSVDGHATFDFIFVDTEGLGLEDYLLEYQASSLSRCCLVPTYQMKTSRLPRESWFNTLHHVTCPEFTQSISRGKAVELNVNKGVCTSGHEQKVKDLCARLGLNLVTVNRPYKVRPKIKMKEYDDILEAVLPHLKDTLL